MKKNLFFAAIALAAWAGCTSDEFVGENSPTSNGDGAIQFASKTPNITRTAASDLENSFYVYATKTIAGSSTDVTTNVFAHNPYSDSSNDPYTVTYTASSENSTTSNTTGWDYVNESASQTIKYWDYSAKTYEFVAYKNTNGGVRSNLTTTGFTFNGSAAAFAGLYVADKITLNNTGENPDVNNSPTTPATGYNKIGNIVKFTFRSGAAKVRLGIYETIPGYNVGNVVFRPAFTEYTFTGADSEVRLCGSFIGQSSSDNKNFHVSFTSGRASYSTDEEPSRFYSFGNMGTSLSSHNYLGESSTTPTWSSSGDGYIFVLPNEDTNKTGNMTLNVDFDLYNTTTLETIHVTDAKAVVPKQYMTWYANHAYTYLFKISDNTNGYTGPAASPRGLYPITFDAVTEATSYTEEGSITTVSTPSITTYQNGYISESGITYAAAETTKPIYITVNIDGTLQNLTSTNTKLYTVNTGTTEADLMLELSSTGKTEVPSGTNALSVPTSGEDETVQGITFTVGKYAKFIPANNQTYAIAYQVSDAVPASYSAPITVVTDVTDVTGLYVRTGTEGNYTYTLATTATAENGKTYCRYNPAIPAGWKYKVIIVGTPT